MDLLIGTPRFPSASSLLLIFWLGIFKVAVSEFDPYVMNGGLLSAVAGRDFIVVATDTRLTGPTGYDILDRRHMASRMWAASPLNQMQLSLSSSNDDHSPCEMFAPDGSLDAHLSEDLLKSSYNKSKKTISSLRVLRESQHSQLPPAIIGSVGCQVDCEHLKRTVRADLRAAMYFGEISSRISVDATAIALSQILYSRRGLPFGSYCVLGGLSTFSGGQVYVYDAIGSYEQVAISCAGTGFELLQPILDRKFAPWISSVDSTKESMKSSNMIQRPPTQVDCLTVEEAVMTLVAAYRSVAEREIGVGDHLVLYTAQKLSKDRFLSKVWTADLKMH